MMRLISYMLILFSLSVPIELTAATQTSSVGGSGGNSIFLIECNEGDFISHIGVRTSQYVEQIRIKCTRPTTHLNWGQVGNWQAWSTHDGIGVDNEESHSCSDHRYVAGVRARTKIYWWSNVVSSLQFQCSRGNHQSISNSIITGPGYPPIEAWQKCSFNQFAVGIYGKSGDMLDSIGLICEKVNFLPVITADAAIVIDNHTGDILYEMFPDQKLANASTTKIMTALLVSESIDNGDIHLSDKVSVVAGNDAPSVRGSCMRLSDQTCGDEEVGLQIGDTLSVKDLLYGLMLRSGNETANSLAAHVSGTVPQFIVRMNERASELGLENTSFVTAHGRDPNDVFENECSGDQDYISKEECAHFSTARDLARLARIALQNSLVAQLVSSEGYITNTWVDSSGTDKNGRLCNTNDFVRDGGICGSKSDAFPGSYGVKTGTTDHAGSCLVSTAERVTGNLTRDVVAVVLGSTDDDARYDDSRILLNFGLNKAIGQGLDD